MAQEDLRAAERTFTNMEFVQGMSIHAQKEYIFTSIHLITAQNDKKFDGVRINTVTKKISLMSLSQDEAYCMVFSIFKAILTSDGSSVRGSDGSRSSIGSTMIQIQFKDLGIRIDVK